MNVVEWAEANWILPETGRPIVLRPWQRRRRPPDGPRRLGRDKTLQKDLARFERDVERFAGKSLAAGLKELDRPASPHG